MTVQKEKWNVNFLRLFPRFSPDLSVGLSVCVCIGELQWIKRILAEYLGCFDILLKEGCV